VPAKVARAAVHAGICVAFAIHAGAPAAAGPVKPFQKAASPAPANIQIKLSADGRKVIFNETPVQYARRFAAKLLPVPDLPGLPSGGLEPIIVRQCGERNLDPRLVRAVIQVESGYNHRARSNKGAIGLMQLMPETAMELAVHDPYDVVENLRGGITYLRRMLDAFPASLEMALAAYNAGPEAVERHQGVPPYRETVDYVQRVMALYQAGGGQVAAATLHYSPGHRPAPYLTRGANGRLLVTTSLSGPH
jgi:soluble lytic murein transglycosylase-like protein